MLHVRTSLCFHNGTRPRVRIHCSAITASFQVFHTDFGLWETSCAGQAAWWLSAALRRWNGGVLDKPGSVRILILEAGHKLRQLKTVYAIALLPRWQRRCPAVLPPPSEWQKLPLWAAPGPCEHHLRWSPTEWKHMHHWHHFVLIHSDQKNNMYHHSLRILLGLLLWSFSL